VKKSRFGQATSDATTMISAATSLNVLDKFPASWRKHTKQRNQLLKVDVSFAIP